jgi:hypothetical protein
MISGSDRQKGRTCMFLKVLKMRQDGPDSPWIEEGVAFYEGQRIYADRKLSEGSPRFWLITIERENGSESVESNPGWRYYILNEHGKTIDSL